jgi:anthranilate phosphoribosyltransferase
MRRLKLGDVLALGPYDLADLAPGATARDQARLVVEVLTGQASRALVDLVAVNAATLIYLGTTQHTVPAAVAVAREVLDSGAALAKLRQLIRLSGGSEAAIEDWA